MPKIPKKPHPQEKKNKKDRIMNYNIHPNRRTEKYVNYTIRKPIIIPSSTEKLFSVPIVPITTCGYKSTEAMDTLRFSFLTKSSLKSIIDECPMTQELFNSKLEQHNVVSIPCVDPDGLPSNVSFSRPTKHDPSRTDITKSNQTGEFCESSLKDEIILSYWMKSPMKSFDQIDSSKLITILNYSFPDFHFGRNRTPGLGINIYNGHPSGQNFRNHPYRCGKESLSHQYYRQEWNVSLLPHVNSCLKILVTEAVQASQYIDPLNKRLLDIATMTYFDPQVHSNRRYRAYGGLELVTLGTRYIPAFCNCSHSDLQDVNNDLKDPCLKCLNNQSVRLCHPHEIHRWNYAKMIVKEIGVGVPTTCGYYLHKGYWKDPKDYKKDMDRKRKRSPCDEIPNKRAKFSDLLDDYLIAFFIMDGLGCGVRLRSNHYHLFHAYAFDHHTSVPYVLRDGVVEFKDVPFNLIAWGDSDEDTKNKKAHAIHMGILQPHERYSQRRIEEYFAVPGRENHLLREFFDVD